MTTVDAFNNVAKACESISASWQVHQVLQESLKILQRIVLEERAQSENR